MKASLRVKLILSYLAIALLTVSVVSALIRLTSGQFMLNMVTEKQTSLLSTSIQNYYQTNGSLDGFSTSMVLGNPQPQVPAGQGAAPQPGDFRGILGLVDSSRRALIPTFGYPVGQVVPADQLQQGVAVKVNGETIAWIIPDTRHSFKLNAEEELILQRTHLAIGLAALAGFLAAVAMGAFLAGRINRPVRRLIEAAGSLAQGNFDQQVPVTSQDELGILSAAFNQMTSELQTADQQRKRMTADITHDLSTPLQIISGYIEMVESGEVDLKPQRASIIKTEIEHLRRLVGDLSTITQVDSGSLEMSLQPEKPYRLLATIAQAYQPIAQRQGVGVILDAAADLPEILVDEGRMLQALKNLVENALRYTPSGGSVYLRARAVGQVELIIEDTGQGMDPADLPYVFERFYRADPARSAGKMGLGLSICKALVTAQHGSISARSPGKGGGTCITLAFAPIPPAVDE